MSERHRLDTISLPPGPSPRDGAGAAPDGLSSPPDGLTQAAGLAELGVLAASLLHELRQPLFAIKAHAQLGATEVNGDARAAERLRKIVEQAGHVEELLRYYGALFRAEPVDAVSMVDVVVPVNAAVELLAHRTRKVGATVQVVHAKGRVRCRELALRQIVVNLVHNALDAVEGGDTRTVSVRTSLLATSLPGRQGGTVRIEVEDSGPGVSDAVRARVFEPFVTTKPAGRGTGLGLYIARRLAEEMGGSLVLGERSRFVVDLPAV